MGFVIVSIFSSLAFCVVFILFNIMYNIVYFQFDDVSYEVAVYIEYKVQVISPNSKKYKRQHNNPANHLCNQKKWDFQRRGQLAYYVNNNDLQIIYVCSQCNSTELVYKPCLYHITSV